MPIKNVQGFQFPLHYALKLFSIHARTSRQSIHAFQRRADVLPDADLRSSISLGALFEP
jgi:hypothetical protein